MALMKEARRFPGQEKMVFEYFTKSRAAMEQLRAPILEEKVVDFIIEKTKITEKKIMPKSSSKAARSVD